GRAGGRKAGDDSRCGRWDRRIGVTTGRSQVRLKAPRAVVGIPLEMFERSKCFVRKGFEELLKGQHAGLETGSLIGRAMLVDPVPHYLLLRAVNRFRLRAPL